MKILGGVRVAETGELVYFCRYNACDFEWSDICGLLENCVLTQTIKEENICCVAVEAIDTSPNSTAPMGIACVVNNSISVFTPKEYHYIAKYLKSVVEGE